MSELEGASAEINEIVGALVKAQAEIKNPERDRTVKVRMKSGGEYEFSYATMSGIMDCIRGPLTKNGLWFSQTLLERETKYRLRTTLFHSSGQWLASETPLLIGEAGNQAFGSALTYMRRYALCALLGITADEDDDGNAGEGHTAQKKAPVQPKQAPRPTRTPHDAKTGEVEPHPIPYDKVLGYTAWGKKLADAFKASRDGMTLQSWWEANAKTLETTQAESGPIYDRLVQVYNETQATLTPNPLNAG